MTELGCSCQFDEMGVQYVRYEKMATVGRAMCKNWGNGLKWFSVYTSWGDGCTVCKRWGDGLNGCVIFNFILLMQRRGPNWAKPAYVILERSLIGCMSSIFSHTKLDARPPFTLQTNYKQTILTNASLSASLPNVHELTNIGTIICIISKFMSAY